MLRDMQKYYLQKSHQKKSFLLDKLIKEKNAIFWKKISRFREESGKKNLVVSQLTLEHFSNFYENLFSHNDRPSDEKQREIEKRVYDYSLELSEDSYDNHTFPKNEVLIIIEKLRINVACGNDGISNEFLKYGCSDVLVDALAWFFNSIIATGHIPNDFNTCLVTPIPKKSVIDQPGDARPISVSSALANILESLILNRSHFLLETKDNQLGYKANTSCKHAFFLVNETINYYNSGKSPLFIISLDASKAFDKLWRGGLFFKLIGKMEPRFWRVLYNYYLRSKIIVKYNNQKSNSIQISEGVKQGGILSPFLFNFFLDGLLANCLDKNIGAKIGETNLSIIGYCDDLLLMSTNPKHLELLLNECVEYAQSWKMEFNSKKSVHLVVGDNPFGQQDYKIGGDTLPVVDSFIYLGLPIFAKSNYNDYFDEKMKKVERSFYSLYGLGCKPRHLSPITIGFIYKQYCQSIFRYGLECLFLTSSKLNEYNIRQNLMIKQSIGLSKYALSTPLLNALRIEKIPEIYHKHKIYFFRQIMMNRLTKKVYETLKKHYTDKKIPKTSFVKQLQIVNSEVGYAVTPETYKQFLIDFSNKFKCENIGLCESVVFYLNCLDKCKESEHEYAECREILSLLLYN
jgi:hypothetical protein